MSQIESVIRDLKSVQSRLKIMPDKTTHQVVVPLGSNAPGKHPLVLMPGHVKHTNEILVLLGDNWFVERSAKEATEIAERRINKAKEILDKLKKEKANHEQWIKTVREVMGDQKEIREEFDERLEEEWRKRHREKVREAKLKEKQQKYQPPIDRDLMKRLEELELQEAENQEYGEDHLDWRREVEKMEEDKKKVRFEDKVTVVPAEKSVEVSEIVPESLDPIGCVVERQQNVPAKPPKAPKTGKGKGMTSLSKFNK